MRLYVISQRTRNTRVSTASPGCLLQHFEIAEEPLLLGRSQTAAKSNPTAFSRQDRLPVVIGKDSTVVIEGFSRDFRIFVTEILEPYLSLGGPHRPILRILLSGYWRRL